MIARATTGLKNEIQELQNVIKILQKRQVNENADRGEYFEILKIFDEYVSNFLVVYQREFDPWMRTQKISRTPPNMEIGNHSKKVLELFNIIKKVIYSFLEKIKILARS